MFRPTVDQLVIITVSGEQVDSLVEALVGDGFKVTEIHGSSKLLGESVISLLVGFDRIRLSRLLFQVRTHCKTYTRYVSTHLDATMAEVHPLMIEAQAGGATVFALNVERFEQVE